MAAAVAASWVVKMAAVVKTAAVEIAGPAATQVMATVAASWAVEMAVVEKAAVALAVEEMVAAASAAVPRARTSSPSPCQQQDHRRQDCLHRRRS